MNRSTRLASVLLPVLLISSGLATARPLWVKFHPEPYRGLNTYILIFAGLTAPSPELEVRILKQAGTDVPPVPVQEFRVNNSFGDRSDAEPSADIVDKFRDYDPDPHQIEIRTVLFLRLGVYEVEVRDAEGMKRSKPINIDNFPQILLKLASQEQSINELEPLVGLPRTDPTPEESPLGVTVEAIALTAPDEIVTRVPEFRWRSPTPDARYVIYLFDQETTIWSQLVEGTSVRYTGPPLVPGSTYYWTVAGEAAGTILVSDEIRKLVIFGGAGSRLNVDGN